MSPLEDPNVYENLRNPRTRLRPRRPHATFAPTFSDFWSPFPDFRSPFCNFWSPFVDFLRLFSLLLAAKNAPIPNIHQPFRTIRPNSRLLRNAESKLDNQKSPQTPSLQLPEKILAALPLVAHRELSFLSGM
jgi:hypothetical protein